MDHEWPISPDKLTRKLAVPSQGRLYYRRYALKMGWSIDQIHEASRIDRWFLAQMQQLVEFEEVILRATPRVSRLVQSHGEVSDPEAVKAVMLQAKQWGYSDVQLATAWGINAGTIAVRSLRQKLGVNPVYKLVDTCAAEFEAATPYYYSTYETPFASLGLSQAVQAALGLVTEDEVFASATNPRSSSSAEAPTASVRGSSLITAAFTRPSP